MPSNSNDVLVAIVNQRDCQALLTEWSDLIVVLGLADWYEVCPRELPTGQVGIYLCDSTCGCNNPSPQVTHSDFPVKGSESHANGSDPRSGGATPPPTS